ncbi:MAG: hypothetical protein ACOZB3_00865 [Calditrichota bacterium]
MKTLLRLLLLSVIPVLVLVGCDNSDDDNSTNPPTTGTLTGKVIFHGEWPDSGTVQLSVFTNWSTDPCSWCGVAPGGPPAYYTHSQYFQDPNPNNGAGPDTVEYTITGITLGTYDAIAMGWRAPTVSDINCDEPVIGMFGADPNTTDSIPEPITFTADQAALTRDVHAYFDMLPIPGCDGRGRIEGKVNVPGEWPTEGLLVMLTTFPASAWMPVMQQPTAYYRMSTRVDSVFRFDPLYGTYYLSLWTNASPPAPVQWYGSYGIQVSAGDARPDAVIISEQVPRVSDVTVNGRSPAPHWISGDVTFNGTRPAEGILVLLSTFMFTPEHPPMGPPTAYFPITNASETLYAFSGITEGTYYVSLWSNTPPPGQPTFYGAYGYTAGSDVDPDPVVISASAWGVNDIDFFGQP